ncbi:hypothetical protein BLNAU_11133 [Blattamonas nauphoetae]|uniref:Uncharacterized protein n=1 Tax=Blattamonas nauphoetae TaxID=2049346 RepID=A0ABQ9XNA5_9EUKA|nr:hypothetical protein BLNAU_11133 [Blattamonas nauphoetae]
MDCSAFLNWSEDADETVQEKAVVFRSLVATLKLQPALDEYLETKAVKFLEYVHETALSSATAFLGSLGRTTDESSPDFVQSIVVLISSTSQVISSATMKMRNSSILWCSPTRRLALVKADLIPQLIITLNPQSLSFDKAVDIHTCLMKTIARSFWLATPDGLEQPEITDHDEQQSVHEIVLQQVLSPSENYILHLCVNRFWIIDGKQSGHFWTYSPVSSQSLLLIDQH